MLTGDIGSFWRSEAESLIRVGSSANVRGERVGESEGRQIFLGFFCKEDRRNRVVSGPREGWLVFFTMEGTKACSYADGKAPVRGENG